MEIWGLLERTFEEGQPISLEMGRVCDSWCLCCGFRDHLDFHPEAIKKVVHGDDTSFCFSLADKNQQSSCWVRQCPITLSWQSFLTWAPGMGATSQAALAEDIGLLMALCGLWTLSVPSEMCAWGQGDRHIFCGRRSVRSGISQDPPGRRRALHPGPGSLDYQRCPIL